MTKTVNLPSPGGRGRRGGGLKFFLSTPAPAYRQAGYLSPIEGEGERVEKFQVSLAIIYL
jgi:hypothetical protein